MKCNALNTCVALYYIESRVHMYEDDEMTRYTREYVDYVWEFGRNEANQTFLNSFDIERCFAHSYFIFTCLGHAVRFTNNKSERASE